MFFLIVLGFVKAHCFIQTQAEEPRGNLPSAPSRCSVTFPRQCKNICNVGRKHFRSIADWIGWLLDGLELKLSRLRKKNMLWILILSLPTTSWTGTIKVYHLIKAPLSLMCKLSLKRYWVLRYWLQTVRKQRSSGRGTRLCRWDNLSVPVTWLWEKPSSNSSA